MNITNMSRKRKNIDAEIYIPNKRHKTHHDPENILGDIDERMKKYILMMYAAFHNE